MGEREKLNCEAEPKKEVKKSNCQRKNSKANKKLPS